MSFDIAAFAIEELSFSQLNERMEDDFDTEGISGTLGNIWDFKGFLGEL
jgi:hypothetical protein